MSEKYSSEGAVPSAIPLVTKPFVCSYKAERAFDVIDIFFCYVYFDGWAIDGFATVRARVLKHALLVIRVEGDVG